MRSHRRQYVIASGHELVGAFLIERDEQVAFVEKLHEQKG